MFGGSASYNSRNSHTNTNSESKPTNIKPSEMSTTFFDGAKESGSLAVYISAFSLSLLFWVVMYFIYNKYVQDQLPPERRTRSSSFIAKLNKILSGNADVEYRGALQSDRDAPHPNSERRGNAILQKIIQQRKEKKE